ncbi:MAG: hypothetical protein IJS08_18630 [Victivallales bacterium]|nr:hypothetical protein [Victivallales bacterium]
MANDLDKKIEAAQVELDKCLAERDDAIYTEEMAIQRVEYMTAQERNSPRGAEALKAMSATKDVSYEKMRAVEQAQAKLKQLEAERNHGSKANEGNPMSNPGKQENEASSSEKTTGYSRGNANDGNPMSKSGNNSYNQGYGRSAVKASGTSYENQGEMKR